jgi:hypothetical protein
MGHDGQLRYLLSMPTSTCHGLTMIKIDNARIAVSKLVLKTKTVSLPMIEFVLGAYKSVDSDMSNIFTDARTARILSCCAGGTRS